MSNTELYILIILFSTIVSIVLEMMLLPRIIFIAKRKRLFDLPDSRKKHSMPIPRLGGFSFVPVVISVTLLSLFIRYKLNLWDSDLLHGVFPEFILLTCGLFLVFALGAKDDLIGVGFKKKFAIQFIASFFIIFSGVYINNLHGLFGIHEVPQYIGIPLSILLIVYTTNALNLIDGADGLASGMSAIAFLVYGSLFFIAHLWTYATMAFVVVGLLIPFFYYNFFHAKKKVFMGDTGSLTLGYILSFMMLRLFKTPLPIEIPAAGHVVLVISALFIPLFDATRVMLVRVITGRSPFSPDRNHIHHKLIDLGLSRRRAVFTIIILGGSLFLINLLLVFCLSPTLVFILDLLICLSIAITLILLTKKKLEKRYKDELIEETHS